MKNPPKIPPGAPVSLREITAETVVAICRLSDTLTRAQKRMVAPNAVSIAQAHFSEHAWFRAIYAGDTPIGFVMLYIGPEEDGEQAEQAGPVYYLWRFMVARPYQGGGFGRKAMQLVIDEVKSRGATELLVSCGEGEASPEGFYRGLGFERDGKVYGDEVGLRLGLNS